MSAKIAAALHDVMTKCAYVQKTRRNDFHKFNYAGEADLLAVLRPAMVEAGLLLLPSVTAVRGPDEFGNTHVEMEYTLAHKDGEIWPHPIKAAGTGNDKNSKGGIGDKGTYKAITGANKYLLFKLFQIETGDDPETVEHDVEPPAQPQRQPPRAVDAPPKPAGFDAGPIRASSAKEWAALYRQRIDGAPTLEDLNRLVRANSETLLKLSHDDPDAYEALAHAIEGQRGFFASHPSGVKAA